MNFTIIPFLPKIILLLTKRYAMLKKVQDCGFQIIDLRRLNYHQGSLIAAMRFESRQFGGKNHASHKILNLNISLSFIIKYIINIICKD